MFSIEVEFLTGRYTAHSKRGYGTTEWPPHPGRLFSALVAAYHEHGYGQEEREALTWLESLSPPKMRVPEARERDTVSVYVPHYDKKKIEQQGDKIELIPKYRASSNKERTFPTVIPDDPIVHFIWEDTDAGKLDALENLASSVPYLGDSSSLVRATVSDDPPEPNLLPTDTDGNRELRVAGKGRLGELERAHDKGRHPEPTGTITYESAQEPEQSTRRTASSDFGSGTDTLILRIKNDVRLPLELSYDLTSSVRDAVISIAEEPVPEWVSGHKPDGSPTKKDHLAYLPLANVAHGWANGSVLGVAVAIPSELERKERETLYSVVKRMEPVSLGSRSEVELELAPTPTKTSLKRDAYLGPSKVWTTVTPYVYDRFPDNNTERTEMIQKACEHIGLPRPSDVYVMENGASPLIGVPNSGNFRLGEAGFSERPRYHVVVEFDTPVRGPVTIGRGRFFGIGFMRSITEDDMR